jgi:hypothetical protein
MAVAVKAVGKYYPFFCQKFFIPPNHSILPKKI